jgi:hypothetical protein
MRKAPQNGFEGLMGICAMVSYMAKWLFMAGFFLADVGRLRHLPLALETT